MKKFFGFLLLGALLLTGCTPGSAPAATEPTGDISNENYIPSGTPGTPVHLDFEKTDEKMLGIEEYVLAPGTPKFTVACSGDTVTADTDAVRCNNGIVTVTGEAAYEFSGELTGMLVVDAGKEDTIHLILSGVKIHSQTSAALYVRKAGRVIVTLTDGTENVLSNGGSFQAVDESQIDGAVFSKKDLAFIGSGSLVIQSPAGHGIVCKDNLLITGGSYTITGAGHGLDANDSIRIGKASLTIEAGQDGIHAETTDDTTTGFVYLSGAAVTVKAAGDGISAGAWLQLESGDYDLNCGGGYENGEEHTDGMGGMGGMGGPGGMGGRPRSSTQTDEDSVSCKGLKAATGLVINGGTVKIDSADDAIHSDLSLVINGGSFTVASGDDAVHAEEVLTVTNCGMDVFTCYEGLEAHEIYVTGGNLRLVSTDDGINAAGGNDDSGNGVRDQWFGNPGGHGGSSTGVVAISGGNLYLQASGDGIDANGSLTITGGYTVVCGPTQGDTAVLDYDNTATISGGTFIGTGSVMMAQTMTSNSGQGVVAVYSQGGFAAGTKLTLTDTSGEVMISYTPELPFQLVILTTPEMKTGTEYTLTVGENSATVKAN